MVVCSQMTGQKAGALQGSPPQSPPTSQRPPHHPFLLRMVFQINLLFPQPQSHHFSETRDREWAECICVLSSLALSVPSGEGEKGPQNQGGGRKAGGEQKRGKKGREGKGRQGRGREREEGRGGERRRERGGERRRERGGESSASKETLPNTTLPHALLCHCFLLSGHLRCIKSSSPQPLPL